jgi:hypothetical protein
MTQVDQGLTKVNRFDWSLVLIKNLGRHMIQKKLGRPYKVKTLLFVFWVWVIGS